MKKVANVSSQADPTSSTLPDQPPWGRQPEPSVGHNEVNGNIDPVGREVV